MINRRDFLKKGLWGALGLPVLVAEYLSLRPRRKMRIYGNTIKGSTKGITVGSGTCIVYNNRIVDCGHSSWDGKYRTTRDG